MKKRIMILLSIFICTVTMASAFSFSYLSAASAGSYTSGGSVTGRVNKAPSNLQGSKTQIGMKKGDRYYLGKNTVGNNSPISWQLITDGIKSGTVTENSWLAMTTKSIKNESAFSTNQKFYICLTANCTLQTNGVLTNSTYSYVGNAQYDDSNLKTSMQLFNQQWSDPSLSQIIGTHTLTRLKQYESGLASVLDGVNTWAYTMLKEYTRTTPTGKNAFLLHYFDYTSEVSVADYGKLYAAFTASAKDYAFTEIYHMHDPYQDSYAKNATIMISPNGTLYHNTDNTILNPYALRPAIFIQKDPIVFAISTLNAGSIASVSSPQLPSNYTNITTNAVGADMKVRVLNNNMEASITELRNEADSASLVSNSGIYQMLQGSKITVKAKGNTAVSGSSLSVLIFNSQGDLVNYAPLGSASGRSESYALDTHDLSDGRYQIAVVNEVFDNTTTDPAYSSEISDVIQLEIVEPHKLAYAKQPQNGAGIGKDYEFSKNVNAGQAVGKVTVNPQGVMPLTYILETNGDNTYQNFELEGLNNGVSSSTSLNVKIKSGAPDLVNGGLKAGTYKFCISTKDANGDPTTATSDSKVCTSFTVEKTNPTIAFDDPNQNHKSVTDAATNWNETATATPNAGTKITYSVSGGDAYLIEIDEDSGEITYKGNGGFGKVKIKATVDDDPSTGDDNYESAFTEKEIVIYREVDGSVTPHSNSSDTTTPTFTASDTNVKVNGIIGTIKGTLGTPDTIGGTTITYKYGLKTGGDASLFSVDANTGVIKATANLGVKSYHITVTVSDKWSTKEIPVTINVGVAAAEDLKFYETTAAINAITTKSVKVTDTGVTVFATVKGSSNNNPVKYKIKDGSTNVIEINENSGAVTIHGVGTVTIVAEKQGAAGQSDAYAELTFTVTAGAQNFIYTDNAGNELPKSGSNYSAKKEVYEPNKTFQLYTAGNPTGSTVSYQLKAGSPTDVISVDASGLVTILNASLNTQMGKVIVQATSHDPSGNYSDKTIELPINIDKGTRVITFADDPIYVVNGSGSVAPVVEVDGVVDTSGDILIEVDSNEDGSIAWTNDNKTIEYDYTESSPKNIKIHATKPMDRNYKVAEADGTIHIMGPDENVLAITSPGKIMYGDHFTIKSTQFDADSTNVQYTFEIDDTTYVSNPTVNGNIAEFDALKYSGSKKTTITVTRTADGESPLSKKVQVTVLPKSITITIDDKEKLKGEQNPVLTYQDFKNQLVTWSGVQDVIQANDIKLSTTAKTNSNAGNYLIKGDANTLNKTYPNYSFKFKEGTLTIKEENIEDDWYHLEINDGNNTAYEGKWTNQAVNIISDHNEYINLSLDQSTWKPNQVTLSKEGETNQSFWMKKDSGAITKEKKEIIKIDKTPPKVKGIKAKDTNNKLQDIINKISGGIFFKPGTSFEVTTSDAKDDLKVSGTKEISYKVYKLDTVARSGEELMKEGKLIVTKEKASITISETVGKYKVCVIPTDNAGNTNTESCHEVELKKIDVDVDGDGKPDFNDPDGDGCSDLNIKWKDPNNESKWIVINGDRDYDGIPDLNIDSDGDGKPDLNIDTDNDGKPDLNLVILKKTDWKPTKCVKADPDNNILEEYCTGTSVKAIINVDTDGDGIPDINIDTNGDMKADLNITKAGNTEPYLNIILPQHVWEPNKDYKSGAFAYDSIGKHDPVINIDTDGDGRPDVNIDLDGDLEPDINIDVDGDLIPDIDIDSTGDGKPDVNVDTNDDGKPDENIVEIKEWKPNKNVDGDVLYDTMNFNDTEDPKHDEPQDPNDDNQPSTSVKGYYNPAASIGGANTGDDTELRLYLSLMILNIGFISYALYSYQKNTFQ